jgi:3-phenylpropionate/trans-cinnamate dioxygenase ferredoxin subunit
MGSVVPIGRADQIPIGSAVVVQVGGRRICVARCVDGFHAIDDTCSHEAEPLSEGDMDPETCEIECWKHGSVFSLETGEALSPPANHSVQVFEVAIEDDEVSVIVP